MPADKRLFMNTTANEYVQRIERNLHESKGNQRGIRYHRGESPNWPSEEQSSGKRWVTYVFPSDPGPFSLRYSILVYPDSILVVSQIFRIRITIHRIHMSPVGYIGYIFGILTRILSGYSIVESNLDTFRIHLEYSIVAKVT